MLADFNNDGNLDIMASGIGRFLLLSSGDFTSNGASTFPTATSLPYQNLGGQKMAAGDFNNDGWADAIFACYGGVELLLNKGSAGGFDLSIVVGSGFWWSVAAGDVNQDGCLDAVVGTVLSPNDNPANMLLLGDCSGSFAPDFEALAMVGAKWWTYDIALADMNA